MPDSSLIHQQARHERAMLIGELIGDTVLWIGRQFSKVAAYFEPVPPLEHCKNAADVINYANSIRRTQPTFADELIAAANRAG